MCVYCIRTHTNRPLLHIEMCSSTCTTCREYLHDMSCRYSRALYIDNVDDKYACKCACMYTCVYVCMYAFSAVLENVATPSTDGITLENPLFQERVTAVAHCKTLPHTATRCNTLQHTATICYTLQHSATHFNTLQHTATHGNRLIHSATLCNTLRVTTATTAVALNGPMQTTLVIRHQT